MAKTLKGNSTKFSPSIIALPKYYLCGLLGGNDPLGG